MTITQAVEKTIDEILDEHQNARISISRPTWDEYFLNLAKVSASKSHDAQTQCGAIIVDENRAIVGLGYNGFPRGVDDELLSNTRPLKYPFIIHAEENALVNCLLCGRSTKGCTIYVTGQPCPHCMKLIYQAGIVEVVYDKNQMIKMMDNEETRNWYKMFRYLVNGKIRIRAI